MERLGADTPSSCAMTGNAVASTVLSSVSMNRAAPTIRAMVRKCGRVVPDSDMNAVYKAADRFRPGFCDPQGVIGVADRAVSKKGPGACRSPSALHDGCG